MFQFLNKIIEKSVIFIKDGRFVYHFSCIIGKKEVVDESRELYGIYRKVNKLR